MGTLVLGTRGKTLAFGDEVQQVEEFREADGGGFCALNHSFAFGAKCGNAECHGDAMIATGVDYGAVKLLSTGDIKPIFELFYFCAHCAKIARDQRDAV